MDKKSFGSSKLGVLLAAVALLAGCSAATPVPTQSPLLDDFTAELTSEIVLTVAGEEFSLADLSLRAAKNIELLEPFSKQDTKFTVISLADLLYDAGYSDQDSVTTIALNDYRFTDTVESFAANGAFLALLENGEQIPVSKGGPVRIVFEEGSAFYQNLDAWNWSLRTIEKAGQ